MSAPTPTATPARHRRARRSAAALITSIAVAASSLLGLATVANAEAPYTVSGTVYLPPMEVGGEYRLATATDDITVTAYLVDTELVTATEAGSTVVSAADLEGDNWSIDVGDGAYLFGFSAPLEAGLADQYLGYGAFSSLDDALYYASWLEPSTIGESSLGNFDAYFEFVDGGDGGGGDGGGGDPGSGYSISGTVSVTPDVGSGASTYQAGLDEVAVTAWQVTYDEFGAMISAQPTVFTVDAAPGADNWSVSGLEAGEYLVQFEYRGNQSNIADAFKGGSYRANEALYNNHIVQVGDAYTSDNVDITLLQGAIIEGLVRSTGGTNLAGQDVVVWRQSRTEYGSVYFEEVTTVSTLSTGRYEVRELPPGKYAVEIGGRSGYLSEYWNDLRFTASAEEAYDTNPIDLTAGQRRSAIDAQLALGSRISGTVKNTAGSGLRSVVVTAYRNDNQGIQEIASVTTSTTGTYTLAGLPAGSYIIGYTPPTTGTTIYLPEFYNNKIYDYQGTPVAVSAGATKTGVNVVLDRAASIAGTVSFASGALPNEDPMNASVIACKRDLVNEYTDCYGQGEADVANDGKYLITGLRAGSYTVFVSYEGAENYRDEYFTNSETLDDATYFTVSTGAAVTSKNVQLDPGATVTGTIRSPEGTALQGVQVTWYGTNNGYTDYSNQSSDYTDADGRYEVTGLNSGEYVGLADPSGSQDGAQYPERFVGGEYSESVADVYTLTTPQTLGNLDVQFDNAVDLSGVIKAESSGLPLEGMSVYLHRFISDTGSRTDVSGPFSTNSAGEYDLPPLPPGSYTVTAATPYWESGPDFYLDEWLGETTRKSLATRLDLTSGVAVAPDLLLNLAGRLTGRIVDSSGDPIAGIPVDSYGSLSDETTTAEDGTFTLGGFDSGPTQVFVGNRNVFSTDTQEFARKAVDGPAVTTDAEPVDMGDIAIERSSVIEGIVVGRTGTPLANIGVYAERIDGALPDTTFEDYFLTDSGGKFTLDSLPTGTYILYFSPGEGASAYAGQYLGGSRNRGLSETVALSSEGTTRFVEARLYAGGTIQGVIKNAVTGAGVAGIDISAGRNDRNEEIFGGEYWEATTSATGSYVLPGLSGGSYDVTFNSRSSNAGTGFSQSSQTVFVPTGSAVTRNISLLPTVRITGKVTSGGVGVKNLTVIAQRVIDGVVIDEYPSVGTTATTTDALGNYTLRVDRGTYVVKVIDDSQQYPLTYLGGVDDSTTATRVSATGTTLTGRNIALPVRTGVIDAEILDDGRWGCITVERVVDGNVVWSLTPGTSILGDPCATTRILDDLFPIENLAPGTYNVRLFSESSYDGEVSTVYEPRDFLAVSVAGGSTTVLDGDLELPGPQAVDFEVDEAVGLEPPTRVIGMEPEIVAPFGFAVGETVTVTEGTWTGDVGVIRYQWLRDGRNIIGATGSTYVLAPGDAGARISVYVTVSILGYEEGLNGITDVYTTPQSPVVELGDAPTLSVAPAVTGALRVGQTLTAKPGTWSIDRLTYAYEWVRSTNSGDPVVVSRASTYKLVTADVAANSTAPQLTLRVTASRTGFASATEELAIGTVVPAVAMVQTTKSTVTAVAGGYRVSAGAWSPSGATYTFGWRYYLADGTYTEHAGVNTATSSTFTTPEVIGSPGRIVATVTATRAGYTPTTVIVPVRSGPQVTIDTPPSIAGTPKVGFTLSIDTESMQTTPTTTTLAYQWLRNGAAITGATKSTYVPTTTDVGRTISVRITAAATGHPTSTATTLTGVVILPVEPFVPGTTTIEGTPSVGRLLRVVTADWAPAPSSYTYQWRRNNVAITGATLSSYRLVSTDLGKTITVTVIAKRTGYANATVTPSAGVITALGPVPVSGVSAGASARVGSTLTVSAGTWDVTPTSYTYQWTRNGTPIVGATSSTYTPLVGDLGDEIGVTVVARKTGYPNSTPTASPTLTVGLGAAVSASGLPLLRVGGLAVTGVLVTQTVTTTAGTWPAVGLDLRYQWQINRGDGNWVDLEGEDQKSLVIEEIPDIEIGQSVRVVVTASRAGYLDSPLAISAPLVVR
ncbi:hypothetical protein [Microcella sp.]|uniref:hypothetical protein n=1 Tax=Microcella sp. TaxID=1913979 RepID=UPI00391B6DC2